MKQKSYMIVLKFLLEVKSRYRLDIPQMIIYISIALDLVSLWKVWYAAVNQMKTTVDLTKTLQMAVWESSTNVSPIFRTKFTLLKALKIIRATFQHMHHLVCSKHWPFRGQNGSNFMNKISWFNRSLHNFLASVTKNND